MSGPQISSTAAQFRLAVIALVARVMAGLDTSRSASLRAALPGLALYEAEAARRWPGAVAREVELAALAFAHPDWPLQRCLQLAPGAIGVDLLVAVLMVEEDSDLAHLIEPDGGFATTGGLIALFRILHGSDDASPVLAALDDFVAAGLFAVIDEAAMRNRKRYRVDPLAAAALLGLPPRAAGLQLLLPADLPDPARWQPHRPGDPPPGAQGGLWHAGAGRVAVIKGPAQNGRKTWAAMAARSAGKAVLRIETALLGDSDRWRSATALAWLLDAVLVTEAEIPPGETLTLPSPSCGPINVAIAIGEAGAISLPPGLYASHVRFDLPDRNARTAHWAAAGLDPAMPGLCEMVLTSGSIGRGAHDARLAAGLAGRKRAGIDDVRSALRGLRDARLEALAAPVDSIGEPDPLFLDAEADEELASILSRCRHRERLGGAGVRVLFSGPSGTGKTLAARHIGRALAKDIHRIDLSATVNKYIGETEKALERALSAAEALDVVLLLDEGDSLMARRTDVGSSNDRYANLETNFLLQRIESFRGIIIVTSNDAERIDPAFARRMDAVIAFKQPDELRRRDILVRQLGETTATPALVEEVACRCALSGGQLRNIAQHARLLALDESRAPGDAELRRAVEREYRKLGAHCPLRPALAAAS